MITFAEHTNTKLIVFATNDLEKLSYEIIDKKHELQSISKLSIKKRKQLEQEIKDLQTKLKKLANKYGIANDSMSVTKLISLPDSYDKLRILRKKLSTVSGKSYEKVQSEIKRLEKKEKSLIAKKKKELYNKWTKVDKSIKASSASISISQKDLSKLVADLYKSYLNSKKFEKKCLAIKMILSQVLPKYKLENQKLYKKYYSVYIDVCQHLENLNFSYKTLIRKLQND